MARIVCGLAACCFLLVGWMALVAGAIGWISQSAGWPWPLVALGLAAVHLLAGCGFLLAARRDELDEISRGERELVPLLKSFWKPFKKLCVLKGKTLTRAEVSRARELGPDPESGRPISVRMGRFGAFVQMGVREDEVKPRFAGLRPGQRMDSVTLEDALHLFKLPKSLGEMEDGRKITVAIGRFGPYVKFGEKYASIKEDDPYTISRERALELIAAKEHLDANRLIQKWDGSEIQVLLGRYGPYITDGKKNAKIPKDRDPKSLSLEECAALIEAAPFRPKGGFKRRSNQPAKA